MNSKVSEERVTTQQWLALFSICISLFVVPQSMSAVNIALPTIAEVLKADAVLVSWVPTANLWGGVLLMLPASRIADMIGRKKVYMIGVFGFILSSLMVLLVNSIEQLLVVRVVQGLFTGLVFGPAMAIVAEVFGAKNRGMALGFTSTSVYLGLTCGPPIGGWLTEAMGWTSVFWVPAPFALCALLMVFFFTRSEKPEQPVTGRLDWFGSLLFIVTITLLLYGLSGLSEWINMASALAGLICLYLFVKQQLNSDYPLIRFKVLAANRVMSRSLLASFLMYAGNYPTIFLVSLYLQYLQGFSPSESGQLVLIQALFMAVLAPLSGKLSDRFQPRLIATIGCVVYSLGFAMLIFLSDDSSVHYVMVAMGLLGIGMGFFTTPNNNAALSSVAKDRLSIGSALLNLSRTCGNMFSMAIVMLLVHVMLGDQQITPDQYPDLLWVVQTGFAIAFGYTILAAWFSYNRGRMNR